LKNASGADSDLKTLGALAALTGRANLSAALWRRADMEEPSLPPTLTAAPALLVFASLGGPIDSLRRLEREVADRLADSTLDDRDELVRQWLARSASLAAPVVAFKSLPQLRGTGDYLLDALADWAAGDATAVRRYLAEARASRRYPDRTIDVAYPETVMFTWLGDDPGAIAWLDATLAYLPQTAPGTFADNLARPGALVNAMALRADLAARTGDRTAAQLWAEAVVILWSDADDFLQPLVSRMRRLAQPDE